MKTKNANDVLSGWQIHAIVYLTTLLYFAALACLAPSRTSAQSVGEKVSAAASETKEKIQDAGKTAANKLEQLWQRIDEQRLKNRTPDEIVAWLIMGLLVGEPPWPGHWPPVVDCLRFRPDRRFPGRNSRSSNPVQPGPGSSPHPLRRPSILPCRWSPGAPGSTPIHVAKAGKDLGA
jgi:hypothetical protein